VDYIREAKKGEAPHNVRVYDEDTRRQIDRMLTDRAVDYIAKNGKGDKPFFLYVPFAFAHHPALAHPTSKVSHLLVSLATAYLSTTTTSAGFSTHCWLQVSTTTRS
jgi:hypothetical protein